MLVYRICKEQELKTIFQEKSFDNIGDHYKNDINKSTHTYEENHKYIHFFEDYTDVFYLDSSERRYICTYDLDKDLLEQGKGIGFYLDRIMYQFKQCVVEYSIENEKINFNDLKKIEVIEEEIDFEDLLDNSYLNKLSCLYENTKEKEKDKVKMIKKD